MQLPYDLSSLVLLPFFDLPTAVFDSISDLVNAGLEDRGEMVADVLLRDVWQLRAEAFVVACIEAEDVNDSLGVLKGYELFF